MHTGLNGATTKKQAKQIFQLLDFSLVYGATMTPQKHTQETKADSVVIIIINFRLGTFQISL